MSTTPPAVLDVAGVYPPIATPFDSNENIDYAKLEHNFQLWDKMPFRGKVGRGKAAEWGTTVEWTIRADHCERDHCRGDQYCIGDLCKGDHCDCRETTVEDTTIEGAIIDWTTVEGTNSEKTTYCRDGPR